MLFIATPYNARACFHFVVYLVWLLYEMDVILLFDKYILVYYILYKNQYRAEYNSYPMT